MNNKLICKNCGSALANFPQLNKKQLTLIQDIIDFVDLYEAYLRKGLQAKGYPGRYEIVLEYKTLFVRQRILRKKLERSSNFKQICEILNQQRPDWEIFKAWPHGACFEYYPIPNDPPGYGIWTDQSKAYENMKATLVTMKRLRSKGGEK